MAEWFDRERVFACTTIQTPTVHEGEFRTLVRQQGLDPDVWLPEVRRAFRSVHATAPVSDYVLAAQTLRESIEARQAMRQRHRLLLSNPGAPGGRRVASTLDNDKTDDGEAEEEEDAPGPPRRRALLPRMA